MQSGLVEEKIATIDNAVASIAAQREFDTTEDIKVESRFGSVSVQPKNAICFPHGLPGIPQSINFCITDLPNVSNNQFKLLQCLNDLAISFVVMPSVYDNALLETDDISDACAMLNINKNNLLLLFIVTVHSTPSGTKLAINAKAPLFVDVSNKIAAQYVFQHDGYEIQQFIS